ncbi:hypothetical protein DH86_00000373 [Scytalidium sp. 3C]|nr:hypothetical protein DH86_00000373 [Scytalidium sp. 3C]
MRGGTAGCVLASRLAEADPNLTILVIEQGMNNYNLPEVIHPALFPHNLFANSKTALFWKGNKAPQLAHREPVVPSGGTLGGGSSINWMVYTRAQRSDFDSWNTPGWTANELWPFLKKFETYHGRGEKEHHGYRGPINVSSGTFRAIRAENDFIDAAAKIGVEYRPNPKFQPGQRVVRKVTASKLVVVSAGANGTPLILERSGVGDPDILKRAGVPVISALPGVGNEYQDHHLTLYPYRTSLTSRETINAFADGRFNVQEMIRKNDKLLGWNSMDASGKFRPTDAEVEALGPEFKKSWDRDFKNKPDRPLMIIALYSSYFGDHATLPDDAEYISMANWTAYPYSRGHIHITGPNLSDPIDFDVGYLKDANDIDVKKHIWAYKTQREMFRRMKIFRGELATGHPRFPKGSKAAVVEKADGPVADDAKRIVYTPEDDKAIEQHVRETVATTWHSLGTCKMAPREKGGVVDASLSVYGVKGLKVADLSVPPENVGGNTNNTALLIGEKAADIFIRELGLGGSYVSRI